MARGSIAGPLGPPIARLYRVEDSNGIRLTGEELKDLVPWLSGETVERVAVPGPRGGIIVTTVDVLGQALALLEPENLQEESAGGRRGDYARFLGMRWPLTFAFEPRGKGGRYTITLPEGARRFGLLPGPEGEVVVFISGMIFEIWDRDDWLKHHKTQALTVDHILRDLEE